MKILLIISMLFISCTANVERSGSQTETKPNTETNLNGGNENKWEKAEKQIVRLSPKEFTDLPEEIISDLEKRGCTVPQAYMPEEKHNVIEGEFKQKGQTDIAVLCSKNKASTILVYWNRSAKEVAEVEKRDDADFLQGIGGGEIGFSRGIDVADAKYINEHYENYGGTKPPPIDHHGINDIFAEKASTVRYFHNNKWLELQGAD